MDVLLPAQAEWSRLTWSGTPSQRGKYPLKSAFIEGTSRLGFWAMRTMVPVTSEIRVYPNLLGERKNLAALFLNRGSFGLHAQRQVGKRRDFEKLREYVPGDDYDEIHWKATARRGRRRDEFEPVARVELFRDLAAHFSAKVDLPAEVTDGVTDEQFLRNVVDVIYHAREERFAAATPVAIK